MPVKTYDKALNSMMQFLMSEKPNIVRRVKMGVSLSRIASEYGVSPNIMYHFTQLCGIAGKVRAWKKSRNHDMR